jgi:hypothetical protein
MNETKVRPNTDYIDNNRAEQLLEKWSPVLDYTSDKVSSIENPHTRVNTAILLENQEQWCIREGNQAGGTTTSAFGTGVDGVAQGGSGSYGSGDTYATSDARLPKILIPMIRRTFPELITNEIVGVQPMSGPVGLAFALRYKYSSTGIDGVAHTVGENGVGQGHHVEASGTAGTAAKGSANAPAGELGHNVVETEYTGVSGTAGLDTGNTGEFGPDGTDTSTISTAFADEGVATDGVTSAGSSGRWVTGGYSREDTGFAAALASFELDSAKNAGTVELSFEKTAVEAGTRRLNARWSVELEQDLKNMNGIDVDAELTNAMSYEIQAEIDREMIIRMVQAALKGGGGVGYSVWQSAKADARWLAERNRDFYQKLIVEANRMAVRNRRGSANFVVATPRVCALLEMLPEFSWMTVDGNVNTQPVGVAKVGNVGGRFNIYRDTRTEAQNLGTADEYSKIEYALLGYKGPEYYDTGIIYCPYIPVMVQRSIDPNSFYPKVGMLTRYGVVDHLFGASNYYHVVFVKGLGQDIANASTHVYS